MGYPLSWHYPDDGGYAGFEMLYCGGYRRHRNIKGAVLGGFILGLGEILIVAFFPQLSGYRDAFAFIVLIVICFINLPAFWAKKRLRRCDEDEKERCFPYFDRYCCTLWRCLLRPDRDGFLYPQDVNLCLVYAIIGLSMNLTNGFVGQFSLGQAGFMAIGAYVVGIFTVPVELRPNVFYAAPMNPLIADIQMPLCWP